MHERKVQSNKNKSAFLPCKDTSFHATKLLNTKQKKENNMTSQTVM